MPGSVHADDGRVVWDSDTYDFLTGEAPDSVNPSLWRQSTLAAKHGLYEVVEGIYQVRGIDLSNTTFVEGDTGVIVIDPLLTMETGVAALALYRKHRGDRPVTGMIYTHSHVDHFGGVRGMITDEDVASGRVPVLAPEGFVEHAVAENIYAGVAMARRAGYMYGAALARGPQGQVGAGLGQTTSTGLATLIPPTVDISTRLDQGTREPSFAADLLDRMADQGQRASTKPNVIFVPLTARELNILRYLATTMTGQEIAQTLYVSINTVKTHQRSIHRKLGANDRREAVARARTLGLL